ncbi:uncharacterized protein VTP21DRAFT_784 [Calcarisporiella thermophila]|uniref:uncharacterized protein n=1 Tax=Calcarisporiella thermophila TaxID=911321 RepID=UPI0037430C65
METKRLNDAERSQAQWSRELNIGKLPSTKHEAQHRHLAEGFRVHVSYLICAPAHSTWTYHDADCLKNFFDSYWPN